MYKLSYLILIHDVISIVKRPLFVQGVLRVLANSNAVDPSGQVLLVAQVMARCSAFTTIDQTRRG